MNNNINNIMTLHTYRGHESAVGKFDCNHWANIIINTDCLSLHQKGIGTVIDISDEILGNIETIEINGFKFVKRN